MLPVASLFYWLTRFPPFPQSPCPIYVELTWLVPLEDLGLPGNAAMMLSCLPLPTVRLYPQLSCFWVVLLTFSCSWVVLFTGSPCMSSTGEPTTAIPFSCSKFSSTPIPGGHVPAGREERKEIHIPLPPFQMAFACSIPTTARMTITQMATSLQPSSLHPHCGGGPSRLLFNPSTLTLPFTATLLSDPPADVPTPRLPVVPVGLSIFSFFRTFSSPLASKLDIKLRRYSAYSSKKGYDLLRASGLIILI